MLTNRKLGELIRRNADFTGIPVIEMFRKFGLIEKVDNRWRFFQETFQEYLCASYIINLGVKPSDFQVRAEKYFYDKVELSKGIIAFYMELRENNTRQKKS